MNKFKKKEYSNADFLERMQRNKANRENYLEQKVQQTPQQKPQPIKNDYIPPDPRIKEQTKLMNKKQALAYRESKLNQGLGRFIK